MRSIAFYRPGKTFPSVSTTGGSCELMCEHCQGRYLRGMLPALTPDALLSLAAELNAAGAEGFLLSGGCDRQGKVPLSPFLPAVRTIKMTTAMKVNLHPGLVSKEEATELAASGADRISFDLTLDEDVLRNRMHLDRRPEEVVRSFRDLCQAAPGKVAPHILLGVGEERMELEAIRLAGEEQVPCIILLSLLGEVVDDQEGRLLRAVQGGVRSGPAILLGCMRPRGCPSLEMAALEAGAAGIACPSPSTVRMIAEKGWQGAWHHCCCALYR